MKWIAATDSGLIPASHEDPRAPGVLKRVIATRDAFQQGHVQMLNWAVLPGHSSFQRHFHQDMQEVFILLSGEVEMRVATECRVLRPGDTVIVDPGEIHQMRNLQAGEAQYLVFGISSGQGGQTIVVGPDKSHASGTPG